MTGLAAKREILRDAIEIRFMNGRSTGKPAAALAALGLIQVATPSLPSQGLAPRRNLEAFGDRFLGLDAFGTSHNS